MDEPDKHLIDELAVATGVAMLQLSSVPICWLQGQMKVNTKNPRRHYILQKSWIYNSLLMLLLALSLTACSNSNNDTDSSTSVDQQKNNNGSESDMRKNSPGSGVNVKTDNGPVVGKEADGYRIFQGIPYSAPPVGALRWNSPQPVQPWSEPIDATKPGPVCAQVSASFADISSITEDCLYLNVTTPKSADSNQLKPVMVWIHGGGGANGEGSIFDARRLAVDGDVVVVTFNYRFGIFGAMSYPGLEGSGTFGLQDQQAALQWVKRNAAAFGGDPNNVTLFGESYGAQATSAQLVSPAAEGLFHRAVIQSGFALIDLPAGTMYPGVPALPSMGWISSSDI